MIKALLGGLGAAALAAAPAAHAASPARAAAPISDGSALGGESSAAPWIIALIIVGGIIWAITEIDEDSPDSP
jgi:hypothetical protein